VEGHAVISHEVLASYAADAAREVDGVQDLVEGTRRHRGVRVAEEDRALTVKVHITLEWGASAPDVGVQVQRRVAQYLKRTAKLPPIAVDVVIARVVPSTAS
jgi:uncharacterized alkaline shock family protein YloU